MTPERHARIKELFLAVSALPPGERAAYLEKAAGRDADLRAQVEELLAHHTEEPPNGAVQPIVIGEGETAPDDPRGLAPTRPAPPTSVESEERPAPVPRNFPPGRIIAGRYRIVGLIGLGGMGEVYRAEDLMLNQAVALKFLPTALAREETWLARLRQEVRVARRVTHSHVCRVHDIAEEDNDWFIVMEYLDGEDLRSLLKRIGRLPEDKALEIARQLCAGLAAAHARKVLHRDLKPANVMVDGRGRAVITDFGLAIPTSEITRGDIRAGTPAYMALEQLTGRAVTTRSDLYALGLVCYEMWTGRAAYHATTRREYVQLKLGGIPERPSQIVGDISPDVERVILQCLEPSPHDRPASALAVLAALPGGDPLSAALAAGETPAPEWVAAGGRTRAPSNFRLLTAMLGCFALLLPAVFLSSKWHPAARDHLQTPPRVLAERARELVADLRQPGLHMHEAFGFSERLGCPWMKLSSGAEPRFACNPESRAVFWERWSPEPLVSAEALELVFGHAQPTPTDPAMHQPGSMRVLLGTDGRLLGLQSVAAPARSTAQSASHVDWTAFFAKAGLSQEAFEESPPSAMPPATFDERRAWTQKGAGSSSRRIRVEAAAYRGALASFAILEAPLEEAADAGVVDYLRRVALVTDTRAALLTALVLISVPLGVRNIRLGRGDLRGGLRLAGFVLVVRMISWLLQAPHTREWDVEFSLIRLAATGALTEGALVALFYLALEPIVRRRWPQTLVAWARILAGRARDAVVGWNVLVGVGLGTFWAVLAFLDGAMTSALGLAGRDPVRPDDFFAPLLSARAALGCTLDLLRSSLYDGLILLLLMALLRSVLHRTWAANVLMFLLLVPMFVPRGSHPLVSLFVIGVGGVVLGLYVLPRVGLVPLITALFVNRVLQRLPLTWDFEAWYADASVFALLIVGGLAVYAWLLARPSKLPVPVLDPG